MENVIMQIAYNILIPIKYLVASVDLNKASLANRNIVWESFQYMLLSAMQ